ncbi:CLUMA_CG014842, isoform A [Clunio marinus]|uniref:CLUMA_CG014842, isoform A n=1 Tax=Clunio marinus TaxID=568069 RepID=A0A1J1ILX6_9DIPT|nr:CLUMA_CG014842, isoform A [Clunio marinus]
MKIFSRRHLRYCERETKNKRRKHLKYKKILEIVVDILVFGKSALKQKGLIPKYKTIKLK